MVNYFFLIFTRFAYQNDFFILGVAILLLVVIALYLFPLSVSRLNLSSITTVGNSLLLVNSPSLGLVFLYVYGMCGKRS